VNEKSHSNKWVSQLANARIKSDPFRTVLTVFAASIIIAVISSGINIGVSIVKSSEQNIYDESGTVAHYRIDDPTEKQLQLLQKQSEIKIIEQKNGDAFFSIKNNSLLADVQMAFDLLLLPSGKEQNTAKEKAFIKWSE